MQSAQVVLNDSEIRIIIKRIAYQIAENNLNQDQILLIGLNERGYFIAKSIHDELKAIIPTTALELFQLDMAKIKSTVVPKSSKIILIDDVINSGKTAFHAATICMGDSVNQIETVFLAVREHRQFPVFANYIGVSIATTLQEHVFFKNDDSNDLCVYLQ